MHAFLISGGTIEKRRAWIDAKSKEWGVGAFDQRAIIPGDGSVGIDQVREFQRSLAVAPALGIIWQGGRLTAEAQHALLKTLEEPPSRTRIILETETTDVLLATVISRCNVVHLKDLSLYSDQECEIWRKSWNKLQTMSIGKKLQGVDAIATDRETAATWVNCGIEVLRQNLEKGESADNMRLLLKARQQLAANVTPKLVLDSLLIATSKL